MVVTDSDLANAHIYRSSGQRAIVSNYLDICFALVSFNVLLYKANKMCF